MDPENYPGSIKRHKVLGPPKETRFWEGEKKWDMTFLGPLKDTRFQEGKGPSKDIRFLGPSKDMRFHEGKHKNGSIKWNEVYNSVSNLFESINAHEDFFTVVTFQRGVTGGAGAEPLLGSANTVWC